MARLIAARVESGPDGRPGLAWLHNAKHGAAEGRKHRDVIRRLSRARGRATATHDRQYGRVHVRHGRRSGFLLVDLVLPGRDEFGRPLGGAFLIAGIPDESESDRIGTRIAEFLAPLGLGLDPEVIGGNIRDAASLCRPKRALPQAIGWMIRLLRAEQVAPGPKDFDRPEPTAPATTAIHRELKVTPAHDPSGQTVAILAPRIMVLRRQDYDRLSYRENSRLLFDDDVTVVPYPPLDGDTPYHPIVQRMAVEQRLIPGTMMIRTPWSDDYVLVDTAYENFGSAKYRAIANVCQALGAKQLTASRLEVLLDRKEGAVTVHLGADGKIVGVDGEVKIDAKELMRLSRYQLHTYHWHGGPADPTAAKEYARAAHMLEDPGIRTLIDQRTAGANLLRSYERTVDITAEATREVRAAADFRAKLSASVIKLKVDGQLETLAKSDRQVKAVLSVQF